MTVSKQDLIDADCWFDVDKTSDAEMTAFKREARWRQHRWAVEEHGISSFGTHRGRRTDPDIAPDDIVNGTKLLDQDADAGMNFLSPAIHEVAKDRVLAKQPAETLEPKRLSRDLLSSMPMAFNLFGEASLPENDVSRKQLAALFGVELQDLSEIIFEWSGARSHPDYTNDRTAFDVALFLIGPKGPRTAIGIETKYHEHSTKEKKPSPSNPDAVARWDRQTEFLVNIANRSQVFKDGWERDVLDTDLRQIWRDHLLALSMRQHPSRWTKETRYVLLYPEGNVSFRDAAERYADVLVKGDTSFQAITIDKVIDAAFAHGGETAQRFRQRYLW